jgi:chaperonin GroEL
VPGGGVALLRAQNKAKTAKTDNEDQRMGVNILVRALEEPIRLIVANSGAEPSVVVAKVAEGKGNFGYNAQTNEFGDMIKMGILDPTKVARTALQNAASVASLILTTEAMVAEAPKKEEHSHGGGMPDMGGMGGMM